MNCLHLQKYSSFSLQLDSVQPTYILRTSQLWRRASVKARTHFSCAEHTQRAMETSVDQWLGHWLLVQRVRGSISRSLSTSEINFSEIYVQRSWFTDNKLVLGLDSFPTHAFRFKCVISWKKHVCVLCTQTLQAINPFRVGKWAPAISRGRNSLTVMEWLCDAGATVFEM